MSATIRIACALLLLAACNFVRRDVEEQAPGATATVPDKVGPTLPPPATSTALLVVDVVTVTETPVAPVMQATPTPGPWRHRVRAGETLGYIIQLYGYRNYDVIDEIVRMNENVPDANLLPGEGSVILVPRPSATPLPPDFTPLPLPPSLAERIAPTSPATGLNFDTTITEHEVVAGQTVVDLIAQHNTTLEIISILNPEISFARCDFGLRSGGPDCNPLLSVGQKVRVPAPTPTPTLSPTFSGQETATPTPTWEPPRVVSPPQNAVLPATILRLQWLSVGALQADEAYLVQVRDESGVLYNAVTRETTHVLPESMIPTDGNPRDLSWTVSVARADENDVYRIISGYPQPRRFRWDSR